MSDFYSTYFGAKSDYDYSANLTNNLSDYYAIRNGSYKKLATAYYKKQEAESDSGSTTSKTYTTLISNASDLKTSADTIVNSKTLFEKKDITTTDAATGVKTTTNDYDKDAIYKAVSSFVDNYNAVIDNLDSVDDESMTKKSANLISLTKANEDLLKNMGITIGTDNTLSIDKDTFKKADINDIKTLFTGNYSYAYEVSLKTTLISNASKNLMAKQDSSYSNSGSYVNKLTSGSLYDTYL